MRILLVNSFYYPSIIGGAEVSTQKLAEGLAKKGHDVCVLCTDLENKDEIVNKVRVIRRKVNNICQPINFNELKFFLKLIYHCIDIFNIFNINMLKSVIKNIKPDVIHINNMYGISPIIWVVAKKYNIPLVQTLRDYYLICLRATLLKRNNCDICSNPIFLCKIYRHFVKLISNKVDFVTAPSQFTMDVFTNCEYFKNANKRLIYNAIDYDTKKLRQLCKEKEQRLMEDKKVKFVFLGSLEYNKGIEKLLNVFSRVQNCNIELHIAGKGSLIDLVKKNIEQDKRIFYHGFIDDYKKEQLLTECDVMIVPSIWYEPFGRVVIDAYKYVMPVIGSQIGGITEIIEHGRTGILVVPNDEEDLYNAIVSFTLRSSIKDMLTNCTTKLQQFSLEEQISSFETVYKTVSLNAKNK